MVCEVFSMLILLVIKCKGFWPMLSFSSKMVLWSLSPDNKEANIHNCGDI